MLSVSADKRDGTESDAVVTRVGSHADDGVVDRHPENHRRSRIDVCAEVGRHVACPGPDKVVRRVRIKLRATAVAIERGPNFAVQEPLARRAIGVGTVSYT